MPDFLSSNSSLPRSADSVLLTAQLSSMEALDNEQQESNKTQKREVSRYNRTRALTHARTEENAKKEALSKSKNTSRVYCTQLNQRDSLQTAGEQIGSSLTSAQPKAKDPTKKPQMPAPSTPFGSGDTSEDDTNIMAIIARVLVMVANVQVKGWKTFWSMGTQNINTSFQMSRAESENTQYQYEQQAQATSCQADQYGKDGSMQISSFALSCGAGLFLGGATEEEKNLASKEETAAKNTIDPKTKGADDTLMEKPEELVPTAPELNDNGTDTTNTAETNNDAANDREVTAEQQQAQEKSLLARAGNKVWSGIKKCYSGFVEGSGTVNKYMGRMFGNGWKYAQMIQPGMNGIQNLVYDKPITNEKAGHEGAQGVYAAAATLARGYAEYNNQVFNRNEDIRQQTTQGVDYAMNIYKSASDALTQAVSTMAR